MHSSENAAFFGLPPKVQFCRLCVISNQRPSSTVEFRNSNSKKETIYFDQSGVCDACRYHSTKQDTDWSAREKKLIEILDKYRRNDGGYDCVVPSSGGKDSSFTAHLLKSKYGMNPLTVTWAPNMFTEVGRNNFQGLIDIGGIDNILYSPNGKVHRLLTKLAFQNLCHPFQPFIHGQKIIGPRIAKNFNIPLIVYGENQAEYGNSIHENLSYKMNEKYFSLDNPMEMILGGVKLKDLLNTYNLSLNDFSAYLPLTTQEIQSSDITVMHLGYFEKWAPQECYYYAAENTGFQAAPLRSDGTYSKYTEIDDKIVPFHFYTTLIKFGIGRATYDAAQEIRNGKITREEGVALVQKFDEEFPKTYFNDFLDYIELSDEEFKTTIDEFRSPHLWDHRQNEWVLRHTVWNENLIIK